MNDELQPAATLVDRAAEPWPARGLERLRALKTFWRLTGLGANLACGLGLYGWLSSRPEVTRHRRAMGLGLAQDLKVAALSDLHLEGRAERYEWILEALRAAEPDLLVLAGDTVEDERSLPLISLFAGVTAPLGKLATLGNWEYCGRVSRRLLERHYDAAGIQLLVNESVPAGNLEIVGVDDWREGQPDTRVILEALERGPALVLSHCPAYFDQVAPRLDRDLARRCVMLSGHTHGGQIAPFGQVLVLPPGSGRYVSGWYEHGGAALYVMRGVGYSGPRLRLGPRPELLLLELV